MASSPIFSVTRTTLQIAAVIVASYAGFFLGLGLYQGLYSLGVSSHAIAGDKSVILVPLLFVVPFVSTTACVLVSRIVGHLQLSKLGIFISLIGCYLGVDIGALITDSLVGRLERAATVSIFLWPAIGGVYSFLGYQAGLILARKWRSRKQAVKSVG